MKSLMRFVIALAIASTCFTSCLIRYNKEAAQANHLSITGELVTTSYDWDNITSIIAESVDVEYHQCDSAFRVDVIADKGYDGRYTISNVSGELKLNLNDVSFRGRRGEFILKVYSPCLNSVSYSGSGDVKFIGGLTSADGLDVSLAGSGDINLGEVKVSSLNVAVAGSGDLDASSVVCNSIELAVAGSGDAALYNVSTNRIVASIAGSGDIVVTGQTESMDAEIAGSGTINVKDLTVSNISERIHGSGKVIR